VTSRCKKTKKAGLWEDNARHSGQHRLELMAEGGKNRGWQQSSDRQTPKNLFLSPATNEEVLQLISRGDPTNSTPPPFIKTPTSEDCKTAKNDDSKTTITPTMSSHPMLSKGLPRFGTGSWERVRCCLCLCVRVCVVCG